MPVVKLHLCQRADYTYETWYGLLLLGVLSYAEFEWNAGILDRSQAQSH